VQQRLGRQIPRLVGARRPLHLRLGRIDGRGGEHHRCLDVDLALRLHEAGELEAAAEELVD
jgi:hypothetical protein